MALVHIDGLADSDGVVFKTHPAGTYPVRIQSVEDTVTGAKSKNPGRPMLKLKCAVEAGNVGEGTTWFLYIVMPTEDMDTDTRQKAIDRIKRLLVACGITEALNEFDTADLQGASFNAVVSLKSEGGVTTNNIVDQLPKQ